MTVADVDAMEADAKRLLEQLEQVREKLRRKEHDSVSSEDEFDDKEFQDARFKRSQGYTSNYASQPLKQEREQQQGYFGVKGRSIAQCIPVSENVYRQQKKQVEEMKYRTENRVMKRTNKDVSSAITSLAAQLKKSKQIVEKKQQKDLQERSKFNSLRLLAFDLPGGYKPIKLDLETTLQENETMSVVTRPANYDKSKDPAYDPLSNKQLSKLYVERSILNEIMQNIKPLPVSKFVVHCSPPDYESPPYPNWAVIGVVSQKSEILTSANNKKYRKVTITNFEIDVLLFVWDKALKRFQDLPLGSMVAILNPQINTYSKRAYSDSATSGFSLKIDSDINCLLVYGKFRYFSVCRHTQNGTKCSTAIDKSKGLYCPLHTNQRYRKATSERLDLTGAYYSFGSKDKYGNDVDLFKQKPDETPVVKSLNSTIAKPKFTLLTNYDSKSTNDNLLSKHQKNAAMFSSTKASLAFFNEKVTNEDAIKKQRKQHELDKKLLKQRALKDAELQRKLLETSEIEIQRRQNLAKKRKLASALKEVAATTKRSLKESQVDKQAQIESKKKNILHLNKVRKQHSVVDLGFVDSDSE